MSTIRTSTPFNAVTPEQIATDIAREYFGFNSFCLIGNRGHDYPSVRLESLHDAIFAAYEAGARENPLRSFTPRELREFSFALYDLVKELDDYAEEDGDGGTTSDLAALWHGILDKLRGHILPREEGDAS
jgi:hypothetical protein